MKQKAGSLKKNQKNQQISNMTDKEDVNDWYQKWNMGY